MKKVFVLVCFTLLTVGCNKPKPEEERYKPGVVLTEGGKPLSEAEKQAIGKQPPRFGNLDPNGMKRNRLTK